MQVKELTTEELKLLIQETVAETIQSLLLDPDEGKEVKPEVKQQLLDSLRQTENGEQGISAEESSKKTRVRLVMPYSVEFTSNATADLEGLTPTTQGRILRKTKWLSVNFDNVSPQALNSNLSGLFKLRVGDYRVIYSFATEKQLITIHKIGHRRDIYN